MPNLSRSVSLRMNRMFAYFALTAAGVLLSACATQEPVLYPNSHFQSVGPVAAQHDVLDCMQIARDAGATAGKGGELTRTTAENATVGGATAGAWGAVRGNAGENAAAGAVAAGTGTLVRGLLRYNQPDGVLRGFVEQCLRERGYQTVGWR